VSSAVQWPRGRSWLLYHEEFWFTRVVPKMTLMGFISRFVKGTNLNVPRFSRFNLRYFMKNSAFCSTLALLSHMR